MKKFFIICAAAVCAMCSCTSESYFDESQVETVEVQKTFWDEDYVKDLCFWNACKSIIEVHKDLDMFVSELTEEQIKKIETKTYDVDDAVAIIYAWWSNDKTFDVMCEWPDWDDFYVYLPEKYYDIYNFYW